MRPTDSVHSDNMKHCSRESGVILLCRTVMLTISCNVFCKELASLVKFFFLTTLRLFHLYLAPEALDVSQACLYPPLRFSAGAALRHLL